MWQRIGEIGPGPGDEPLVHVRVERAGDGGEVDRPGLPSTAFSRSAKFVTRHATWGGVVNQAPVSVLQPVSDSEIEDLQKALRDELARQRAAGNLWFGQRFEIAGLAEVVQARPDLLEQWLGDNEDVTKRMWLARSFYEALCEVLLTCHPARGADLYQRLQQPGATRFADRRTNIPILEYALFDAPESTATRALWNARLESAKTDRDLLHLALLASAGPARSWLEARVTTDLGSAVPFVKVRAITLLGFLQTDPLSISVPELPSDVKEWEEQQMKFALRNWRSDHWARTWFGRFLTEPSNDRALASFRLFLSCADSRFSLWCDEILDGLSEARKRFVLTSRDEIERSIEKNEHDLVQSYLGKRVAEDQVWPWM